MNLKGRCFECTARRLRRGRIIGLPWDGETRYFHPPCAVIWLKRAKSSTALRAKLRAALEARKIVKPAASSARAELRARVDAMPGAVVPQHPVGWTPEDEEAAS